ncbi:MFS-type transporter SLC18B1-like isoform X1 [Stegodyphus dumicola]|uniref:MFS-type transporter SLC18B1-like isoform X1 n=2 Tax=Stegodyphus dumicola TaxID=202533 RepID=UPI0015AC2B3E|nr:MFS-type transporter SLC18B1-like isoform X1 [Stegodyphus dumicola]
MHGVKAQPFLQPAVTDERIGLLLTSSASYGIESDMTFSVSSELSKKNGEVPANVKKKVLTPRKIRILASVIYGNLFLGSCYSLMAPIFPAEAERKHASATAYGLVFGIYQLVMFLSAPVYGKLVVHLKPGFMMKIGMFVSGVCAITFG